MEDHRAAYTPNGQKQKSSWYKHKYEGNGLKQPDGFPESTPSTSESKNFQTQKPQTNWQEIVERNRKRKERQLSDFTNRKSTQNVGTPRRAYVKPEPVEYSNLLICGYSVKLPPKLEPYRTQRTMIAKVLMSLRNRLNALIESPTGSGKTLGLLSSTCAWLAKYKEEREQSKAECSACGGHVKAAYPNGSDTVERDNSNESDSNLNGHRDNPGILSALEQKWQTLEDEFDSDFCASPSSEGFRTISSPNDSKRLKLEDTEDSDTREGHTCLPKVVIYYGTRTHKQISQVVKEFARLPYGHDGTLRHTVLASREHSCINLAARGSGDINAKCKELIAPDGIGCSFRNAMRQKFERPLKVRQLIAQNSEQLDHVWDIEDLVASLKISSPSICPYFASTRILSQDADIVFCPFSYMIDPIIRENSDVTLKNAVVILDEAHNVEDVCREAVSFSFTEKEIVSACAEFRTKGAHVESAIEKTNKKIAAQVGVVDESVEERNFQLEDALSRLSSSYGTLNRFANDILDWFVSVATEVAKQPASNDNRFTAVYSWERLYTSLNDAKLAVFEKQGKGSAFAAVLESLNAVAGGAQEAEQPIILRKFNASGTAVVCIEKFLYFFRTYFKEDNRTCYKLFICIDKPFVAFSRSRFNDNSEFHADVLDMSAVNGSIDGERPVWIDSKSSLNGYQELKRGFRVSIDFWCMRPALAYLDAFKNTRSVILASGTLCPTDTFRTELGTDFQQQMEGSQVIPNEQIFAAVVPAGPSGYRLCGTYKNINMDDRFIRELSSVIRSVCETVPKGILCFLTSYRMLDQLYEFMEMAGTLRQIQTIKLVLREPRRSSQMNDVMTEYTQAIEDPASYGPMCTGALMFAVFRGKVSEGVDFTDDLARCVISVGIPFPNARDEQVNEKKRYNDENAKKMRILSGDEWYTMQAYRALNQALGRCLRHRSDWGAILMVDDRLLQNRSNPNAAKISKWIREQLRPLSSYKHFLHELTAFVTSMQNRTTVAGDAEAAPVKMEITQD